MKILITIVLLLSGSIAFAQRDTNAHEIPWIPIKKEDILWKKRVWREIAVYEKQNAPLWDDPASPQENVFANVLLSGINAGAYKAYAADTENDRLRLRERDQDELHPEKVDKWVDRSDNSLPELNLVPLTKEEVNKIIACEPDQLSTRARMYINFCTRHRNDTSALSNYDSTSVTSCIYPQQVDYYGLIEDWIFDRTQGQMVVHIKAIAPMIKRKPLFWLSYPDIRRWMVQHEVYQPDREKKMTWDEYFESRQFSSKITRVSGPTSSSDH